MFLKKTLYSTKNFLKMIFYSPHNEEKRKWFFKKFLNIRQQIQKEFYDFFSKHKVQILFFDWFDLFYAPRNNIVFPFSKSVNPITSHNKQRFCHLSNDTKIQVDHPPLRNIIIQVGDKSIDLQPYKIILWVCNLPL